MYAFHIENKTSKEYQKQVLKIADEMAKLSKDKHFYCIVKTTSFLTLDQYLNAIGISTLNQYSFMQSTVLFFILEQTLVVSTLVYIENNISTFYQFTNVLISWRDPSHDNVIAVQTVKRTSTITYTLTKDFISLHINKEPKLIFSKKSL